MLGGLKKRSDLQERYQEAIKEMEDFLDESKEDAPSFEAQSKSIVGEASTGYLRKQHHLSFGR